MIWLILAIGLILRLVSLNQSLWLDEAINVLATKNYSFLGMIKEYAKADFHPPGYFIISWIWNNFFGIDEVYIRIPSVIFGVLTIYIIYLIGKKLHSKTLGLISAFLLAINPLHIYYSQEARMYALATLAVSLNMLLFINLVRGDKGNMGNRVNMVRYSLSNLLVLTSDYLAYFIFPGQLIFIFIFKKKLIKEWIIALALAGLAGIWWMPIFLSQLDIGSVASVNLPTWKFVVGGFDIKGVPITFVKFIIGRISHPDKVIYAMALLPITLLFLSLFLRGIKFIKNSERILLIIWLFVPIILASLISFIVPIYSYFRLLFTLPAFLIFISLGIISFKSKLRYAFLTLVAFIELFSASVYLFNPIYQREDWKGLVNFLKSKDKSLVLLESSGTLPPFDYYSKGAIFAKGALKDFPAKNEGDVIDLNSYADSKDYYLVDYLVDISDPKRVVSTKLKSMGYKNIDTLDFHGVGFVYHYVK